MKISIRVYDNANSKTPTADRYTIVFHGRYRHLSGGRQEYIGCCESPSHPQGIGMHGESRTDIDYPSYSHLGKKLNGEGVKALAADVKQFIKQTVRGYFAPELYRFNENDMENIINLGHVSFPKIRASRRGVRH